MSELPMGNVINDDENYMVKERVSLPDSNICVD